MKFNEKLFEETSHSPSLISLYGYEGVKDIIDFCFIANPYYPTEEMMGEMLALFPTLIKNYPNSNTKKNEAFLAQVLGIDNKNIIIGNGATELITELCSNFIDTIGVPIPTFSEYIEKVLPAKVFVYPLNRLNNYQLDLKDYFNWLDEKNIKAALIINPHNPTGQLFQLDELYHFLENAKNLDMVIVDESFLDFSQKNPPSLLHSTRSFQNLVIVRSMSKHCGVPGLRLGYLYSSNEQLIKKIRKVLPTWNVNTIAEFFLTLLPKTEKEYHDSRIKVIEDMNHLYLELQKIDGFEVYPTGANFILLKVKNGMTARELQTILLRDFKMYVRDCSNKQGMDDFHIRIATQGILKDKLLIDSLRLISTNQIKNIPVYRKKSPRILIPTAHENRKNKKIQYVGDAHLEMVLQHGGVPILIPSIENNYDNLLELLDDCDGLLLMEGEDLTPELYETTEEEKLWIEKTNATRDKIEKKLLTKALEKKIPILAICRGSQLLNVVLGGTLYTDVHKSRSNSDLHINILNYDSHRHGLKIVKDSWLYGIYQTDNIMVNSYHHQGIKKLGENLEIMATANDGLIEAFKHKGDQFAVGLQYHPERFPEAYEGNLRIFNAFIAESKK